MAYIRATKFEGPQWILQERLSSAQMNHVEDGLIHAIDGYGGGTYSPTSQLIIGGPFATHFLSGLSVTGDEGISGSLTVGNNILVDGDLAVMGDVGIVGTATVNHLVANDATVAAFLGTTGFTGDVQFNGDEAHLGTVGFGGTVNIDDDLVFENSGKMVRRVTIGTNSDSTYGVNASDIVKININANRIYTVSESGAVNGASIIFYFENNLTNYARCTIKNAAAASITVLAPNSTVTTTANAEIFPNWCELLRVGGAWELFRVGFGGQVNA